MELFDAHIHYADTQGPARVEAILRENGIAHCCLVCIHQEGLFSTVPDALRFKAAHPGAVHVLGSLERTAYFLLQNDPAALSEALVRQGQALLAAGCDGVKLLEGKPDIRRAVPIPDFDSEVWAPFWQWAQENRVPIVWHVNDPADFWDEAKINPYARSRGWFYGPEMINNQVQYNQVERVLVRWPHLRIQFAHMLFFSSDLPRLADWMRRFPDICVDLTPGIELYYDMAAHIEQTREFFAEFETRIFFGSDIGSRSCIASPPAPIDGEESAARVRVIRTFLQTPFGQPYTLHPDGKYLFGIPPAPLRGLGLSPSALARVCGQNAAGFYGVPAPVDEAAASRLAAGYEAGVARYQAI